MVMAAPGKFSLILATVDRVDEPARLLRSLDEQSCRDFELVVVDQNPDDRIGALLALYCDRFTVIHLRTAVRGLSRARNLGLAHISGAIVAFPDDDCWYPTSTLERVAKLLATERGWDGVCGRSLDQAGVASHARWPSHAARVSKFRLWAISFATFLRRPAIETVGQFDEALGVGAGTPWGACEESDYFLRSLQAGFRILYDPALVVMHPQPVVAYNAAALRRAYSYGMGQGRFLRMHRYPAAFVAYRLARTLAGAAAALAAGRADKARYHWKVFEGRLRGWKTPI